MGIDLENIFENNIGKKEPGISSSFNFFASSILQGEAPVVLTFFSQGMKYQPLSHLIKKE